MLKFDKQDWIVIAIGAAILATGLGLTYFDEQDKLVTRYDNMTDVERDDAWDKLDKEIEQRKKADAVAECKEIGSDWIPGIGGIPSHCSPFTNDFYERMNAFIAVNGDKPLTAKQFVIVNEQFMKDMARMEARQDEVNALIRECVHNDNIAACKEVIEEGRSE